MGKELTNVLMQRLPGKWITNIELEAVFKERQAANNLLNETYRQYTAIVTRIDELAQLSPSIPHDTFVKRLGTHSEYLAKEATAFRNALIATQKRLKVDQNYVSYVIDLTSYLQNAISDVLENKDDGTRLRELSRSFPINKAFAEMMDGVSFGRPPTGWSKPRFWAGQTIHKLHQDHPDQTYMMLLPIALELLAETADLTISEKQECRISYLTNTKNKRLSNLATEWKNTHLGILGTHEHS